MSDKHAINRKAFIPGAITSFNMFLGFQSIYFAMQGRIIAASWLIILAACMDGLDGKIARVLNAASKFGKEFDSLADVISFGIAPAVLIMSLEIGSGWQQIILPFLFLLAGASRLARYNCQEPGADSKGFAGMPIPSAAITLTTYIIFSEHMWGEVRYFAFLAGLVILVSVLMISVIRYDSFPNMTERTLTSNIQLGIFLVSLVLLARYPNTYFFLFMMGYITFGIVRWVFEKYFAVDTLEEDEDPLSLGD